MYLKAGLIGGGGFGRVHECKGTDGVNYALRELNLENCGGDPEFEKNMTKRFKQEAAKST